MNIRETLAGNVSALRQQKGWSQEKLAEQASLHRTYVSQIETGARNPTIAIIERLAVALEVKAHELLKPLQGDN